MDIGELEEMFRDVEDDVMLDWGIGEPDSWRGSYDEVCFPVVRGILAGDCKDNIESALNRTFYGYKGGEFKFDHGTPVNFEPDDATFSAGAYRDNMIEEITLSKLPSDTDAFLVALMIKL